MANLAPADETMLIRQYAFLCVECNKAHEAAERIGGKYGVASSKYACYFNIYEHRRGQVDGMRHALDVLGVPYSDKWDKDFFCVAVWQLGRLANVNLLQEVMLEVA